MTCTIPLTRGLVAICDDEDYPMVSQFVWQAQPGRHKSTFYAASMQMVGGKRRKVYMHRMIADAPKGSVVHHGDDDGLNNCRRNLFVCGFDDNAHAAQCTISALGYRGVSRHGSRFQARIRARGERITLGTFATVEEAAAAYDKAAIETYGVLAWTNERNLRAPVSRPKHDIPF